MGRSNLRKIYESRGHDRAGVARHMGVSESLVYKWETEKRNINGDQLRKLASFLNCSTDAILGLEEPFKVLTAPSYDGAEVSGTVAE